MPVQNEYSKLFELALASGTPHSELVNSIHEKVREHYTTLYPTVTDPQIVVDAKTGEVRIFANGKDITPDNFKALAEKLVREVLIGSLSDSRTLSSKTIITPHSPDEVNSLSKSFVSFIVGFLFWGYNSLLVLYSILFVINIAFDDRLSTTLAEIGSFRLAVITVLILTPVAALGIAINRLRNKMPVEYVRLTFVFEIPFLLVSYLAYHIIPEVSPSIGFVFGLLFLAIPILYMYSANIKFENKYIHTALFIVKQFLLLTSSYLTLLYIFFLPPILGSIVNNFDVSTITDIFTNLILLFWALIMLAFMIMPFVVLFFLAKIVKQAYDETIQKTTKQTANAQMVLFSFLWLMTLALIAYQPKPDKHIALLEQYTTIKTYEEKQALVVEMTEDKATIENAVSTLKNARSLYPWHKGENILKSDYERYLEMSDDTAEQIDSAFKTLAYPFVYQKDLRTYNPTTALTTYKLIFGDKTYVSTPTPSVNLIKRAISVTTDYDGLLATITIDEEYKNTTSRNQEVIYEFYLPENAVMTDLKLGPDLEFTGIIAPRGAAERTFNAQVQQRRDPALLEQISTNSYRLRVFPIPGVNDTTTLNGRNQRLSYTYVVAATKDGYSLPHYSTKTNLNDANTNFIVSINDSLQAFDSKTLREGTYVKLERDNNLCNALLTSRSTYPEALVQGLTITNDSICNPDNAINQTRGKNIAIFIDTSVDNKSSELIKDLELFVTRYPNLLELNTVDIYKYSDLVSKAVKLTQSTKSSVLDTVFFGKKITFSEAYSKLENRQYDSIFVLTNSKDQTFSGNSSTTLPENTYFVYSDYPGFMSQNWTVSQIYNSNPVFLDLTQAFIYSTTADTSFSSVLATQFTEVPITPPSSLPLISPTSTPVDDKISTSPTDPLSYLVAQAYVHDMLNVSSLVSSQDKNNVHSIAQHANIVTPYSSNIALVNQTQLSQLERESLRADSFTEQPQTRKTGPINLNSPSTFESLESPMIGSMFGVNSMMADDSIIGSPGDSIRFGMSDTTGSRRSRLSPASVWGLIPAVFIAGIIAFIVKMRLDKRTKHHD